MKPTSKFFALLILVAAVYGQTDISREKLDSLYYKILSSHNITNIKFPSPFTADEGTIKCGFGLNAEIKYYFDQFTLEQQFTLQKVMSRPDLQTSIVSKSGKFRIHYDETGTNKPAYEPTLSAIENAQLVADAFDSSYAFEVGYLKYPEPPKDNGKGGDDLYDIYIINYNGSYYAETWSDSLIGNRLYTSYMEFENDFNDKYNNGEYKYTTQGINGARVTAAHEFHHAIQIGNYALKTADLYFHELTSTSMEEFVYDSINDYYDYLSDFFYKPACSFTEFTEGNAIYGQGIWNIFLFEKYGTITYDIIKRQWELFRQTSALEAINTSLSENQISFKQALNEFGVWCYLTNYRKSSETEGHSFSEGKNYPVLKPSASRIFSGTDSSFALSTKPMANNFIRVLSNNGTYIDTIIAIVTNADFSNGLTSPNSDFAFMLNMYNYEAAGSQKITNNYYAKLTTTNDFYKLATIFNNEVNPGENSTIVTADYVFPNPFRYSKQNKIYIPVEYNADMFASFNIYSVDMNLVYSSDGKIQTLFDKFVLSWDGMDNNHKKLPTGVYIYISNSDDKLKKGKLVIYND